MLLKVASVDVCRGCRDGRQRIGCSRGAWLGSWKFLIRQFPFLCLDAWGRHKLVQCRGLYLFGPFFLDLQTVSVDGGGVCVLDGEVVNGAS